MAVAGWDSGPAPDPGQDVDPRGRVTGHRPLRSVAGGPGPGRLRLGVREVDEAAPRIFGLQSEGGAEATSHRRRDREPEARSFRELPCPLAAIEGLEDPLSLSRFDTRAAIDNFEPDPTALVGTGSYRRLPSGLGGRLQRSAQAKAPLRPFPRGRPEGCRW